MDVETPRPALKKTGWPIAGPEIAKGHRDPVVGAIPAALARCGIERRAAAARLEPIFLNANKR